MSKLKPAGKIYWVHANDAHYGYVRGVEVGRILNNPIGYQYPYKIEVLRVSLVWEEQEYTSLDHAKRAVKDLLVRYGSKIFTIDN